MTLAQTKTRASDVQATTTLEIEIMLTGTYQPGYPERGPTYDCGGEPAEPDCMEDVEIGGIAAVGREYQSPGQYVWTETSLLEGVNVNSPDIQRLFANILQHIGDEAEQVLLAEVGE